VDWSRPRLTKPPVLQPRGVDFQLLWELSFSGTGLLEPGAMTIDAVTGAVLATTSGLIE
jgi:hypothetical protein